MLDPTEKALLDAALELATVNIDTAVPPETLAGALQQLEERDVLHATDIEEFLRSRTFPIVDGRSVTFVFVGAADAVSLRHWIHGLPSTQAFQRFHDTPLWTLTLDVPEGSRLEYKLEIVRGDLKHRASLDAACAGADVVISTVSVIGTDSS